MKTRKFKGYTISDRLPKEGDKMICVTKKNINYGKTEIVTKLMTTTVPVDTKNWKVIETTNK